MASFASAIMAQSYESFKEKNYGCFERGVGKSHKVLTHSVM